MWSWPVWGGDATATPAVSRHPDGSRTEPCGYIDDPIWACHAQLDRKAVKTMKIEQLYRAGSLVCGLDDTLAAAARLMRTNQVGALGVCDGELLVGVISEHDLSEAVADGADPDTVTVEKYATRGIRTVGPEEDFSTVVPRMLAFGIRHMPVVQDGTVRGMLSMRDLFVFEMWDRTEASTPT